MAGVHEPVYSEILSTEEFDIVKTIETIGRGTQSVANSLSKLTNVIKSLNKWRKIISPLLENMINILEAKNPIVICEGRVKDLSTYISSLDSSMKKTNSFFKEVLNDSESSTKVSLERKIDRLYDEILEVKRELCLEYLKLEKKVNSLKKVNQRILANNKPVENKVLRGNNEPVENKVLGGNNEPVENKVLGENNEPVENKVLGGNNDPVYENKVFGGNNEPVYQNTILEGNSKKNELLNQKCSQIQTDILKRLARVEMSIFTDIHYYCSTSRQECSNSNLSYGRFIWVLDNFAEKMTDSILKKKVYFSPTFYSSQYGYKLQVKAYLNGMGHWEGRHMVLSIVRCTSPWDCLLTWPCNLNASLTLVDQTESIEAKHKTRSFSSVKFGEESSMRVYMSHRSLKENNYVLNNTVIFDINVSEKIIN